LSIFKEPTRRSKGGRGAVYRIFSDFSPKKIVESLFFFTAAVVYFLVEWVRGFSPLGRRRTFAGDSWPWPFLVSLPSCRIISKIASPVLPEISRVRRTPTDLREIAGGNLCFGIAADV
jgi:hypothetical protein